MRNPGLYPSIVSDTNVSERGLIADNIMTFGHRFAADQCRKHGMCFSLCYFLTFGRAPRSAHLRAPR